MTPQLHSNKKRRILWRYVRRNNFYLLDRTIKWCETFSLVSFSAERSSHSWASLKKPTLGISSRCQIPLKPPIIGGRPGEAKCLQAWCHSIGNMIIQTRSRACIFRMENVRTSASTSCYDVSPVKQSFEYVHKWFSKCLGGEWEGEGHKILSHGGV